MSEVWSMASLKRSFFKGGAKKSNFPPTVLLKSLIFYKGGSNSITEIYEKDTLHKGRVGGKKCKIYGIFHNGRGLWKRAKKISMKNKSCMESNNSFRNKLIIYYFYLFIFIFWGEGGSDSSPPTGWSVMENPIPLIFFNPSLFSLSWVELWNFLKPDTELFLEVCWTDVHWNEILDFNCVPLFSLYSCVMQFFRNIFGLKILAKDYIYNKINFHFSIEISFELYWLVLRSCFTLSTAL